MQTIPYKWYCWIASVWISPLQKATQRKEAFGKNQERNSVWSCSLQFWSTREFRGKPCLLFIFCRNIKVSKDDIGPLLREGAEKHGFQNQIKTMLISSLFLENVTKKTPFLLFQLFLGLICKQKWLTCAVYSDDVSQQFSSLPRTIKKEMRKRILLLWLQQKRLANS